MTSAIPAVCMRKNENNYSTKSFSSFPFEYFCYCCRVPGRLQEISTSFSFPYFHFNYYSSTWGRYLEMKTLQPDQLQQKALLNQPKMTTNYKPEPAGIPAFRPRCRKWRVKYTFSEFSDLKNVCKGFWDNNKTEHVPSLSLASSSSPTLSSLKKIKKLKLLEN